MDVHKTIAACLAFYEAFRRLGFKPQEIFFAQDADHIGMILRVAGHSDYPLLAGPFDQVAIEQWPEAARMWNDPVNGFSYVERNIMWQTYMPTMNFVGLTSSLIAAGYEPPGLEPEALAKARQIFADGMSLVNPEAKA